MILLHLQHPDVLRLRVELLNVLFDFIWQNYLKRQPLSGCLLLFEGMSPRFRVPYIPFNSSAFFGSSVAWVVASRRLADGFKNTLLEPDLTRYSMSVIL